MFYIFIILLILIILIIVIIYNFNKSKKDTILLFTNQTNNDAALLLTFSNNGQTLFQGNIGTMQTIKIDDPGQPINIFFTNPTNVSKSVEQFNFKLTNTSGEFTVNDNYKSLQFYDAVNQSCDNAPTLNFKLTTGWCTFDSAILLTTLTLNITSLTNIPIYTATIDPVESFNESEFQLNKVSSLCQYIGKKVNISFSGEIPTVVQLCQNGMGQNITSLKLPETEICVTGSSFSYTVSDVVPTDQVLNFIIKEPCPVPN